MHLGKKELGGLVVGLVVAAEGEEVAHLLVEALFGRADLADARQQFVEVVPATGVLEAFVVHDEAFDQVFGQVGGGPLAELGAAHRTHPVAHGEDEGQAVQLHLALHAAFSLGLNCQGILDSCLFTEFPLGQDVLDVQADVLFGGVEQLRYLLLIQPDAAVHRSKLNPGQTVVGLVNHQCTHAVTSLSRATMSRSRSAMSCSMAASGRGGLYS